MYYLSLYYVFFIVLVLNCCYSDALQCGGGSVLRSQLYGGSADDFVWSVNLDSTGLLKLAGQTSDGAWTGGSVGFAPDYWVAVIEQGNERFSLLNVGQDNIYNADLSSQDLCIVGNSDSYDYLAVWRNGTSTLTAAPTWTYSGSGSNFDFARGIVCNTEYAYMISNIDFSALGDGTSDVVLKQFTIDGSAVRNLTYSGSDVDTATDAAVRSDVIVIVGQTLSANFPTSSGAAQATKGAGRDAFVMAINITSGATIFSTFYGGNGEDYAHAVVVDSDGYIYVCGQTSSNDLALPNAYSSTQAGASDAWLAIWSPQGTLLFATLFGSDGGDMARDIALLNAYDGGHLIYLTGSTDGTNFPLVENFDGTLGATDAFVLTYRLHNDFTTGELIFSTRFGGSADDTSNTISVRDNGHIAIGGDTQSANFPANGTYQSSRDAYYTIFECPGIIPVPPSPSPSASPSPAGTPVCQTGDGCYQASELAVQFTESADGGYAPSQTIYPSSVDGEINTGTSLAVNYHRLEERDPQGNVVSQEEFPTTGYQLSVTSEDIGGTPVQVVAFTNRLASGTNITILNYLFETDTTFDFAGASFPVAGSSTKSNIRIQGWPFQSTENTFHMHIDLGIYPPPQPPVSSVAGDITQYSFQTGVSSCEVSVLDLAVVDESSTPVTSTVTENKIQVNMPYFSDSILYDPGYTVLVQNDQESSPKEKEPVSQWYYIGAAIGVAVIAAIIAGFMLTFMKNKRRRQRAKTRAAIQHASEIMQSNYSASEVSTV